MSHLNAPREPHPISIRHATPSDADLLARLGAQSFEEAFGPDNSPADLAAYVSANFSQDKLSIELADPATRFLIAEIETEIQECREKIGLATLRVGSLMSRDATDETVAAMQEAKAVAERYNDIWKELEKKLEKLKDEKRDL